MFAVVMGIIGAYVALRVVPPLDIPLSGKIALVLVILLLAENHLLTRLVYGNMFSLELPRAAVVAVNVGFGAILLTAALHLVLDLVSLGRSLLLWDWQPLPPAWSAGAVLVALAVAAFGVFNAVRQPAQKDLAIEIDDLPAAFDGYEIVHLTDLHLSRLFHRPFAEKLVARVNALAPDVIVISGDLIDGYLDVRRHDIAPLSGLTAADGVFVSPGNHEYYFEFESWWETYRQLGMRPLANAHATIEREGSALVVAGVTDLGAGRFGLPGPDVDRALHGAPDGAPVLLLNHQPRQAHRMAERGVDLHLAGHTHGGMVVGLASLIARFNAGFVSGHYTVGDMQLYVSNGTALWPGFALRLGVPSELTRITLRPRTGTSAREPSDGVQPGS